MFHVEHKSTLRLIIVFLFARSVSKGDFGCHSTDFPHPPLLEMVEESQISGIAMRHNDLQPIAMVRIEVKNSIIPEFTSGTK